MCIYRSTYTSCGHSHELRRVCPCNHCCPCLPERFTGVECISKSTIIPEQCPTCEKGSFVRAQFESFVERQMEGKHRGPAEPWDMLQRGGARAQARTIPEISGGDTNGNNGKGGGVAGNTQAGMRNGSPRPVNIQDGTKTDVSGIAQTEASRQPETDQACETEEVAQLDLDMSGDDWHIDIFGNSSGGGAEATTTTILTEPVLDLDAASTSGPEASPNTTPTSEPETTTTVIPTSGPETTTAVVQANEPVVTAGSISASEPESIANTTSASEPETATTASSTSEPDIEPDIPPSAVSADELEATPSATPVSESIPEPIMPRIHKTSRSVPGIIVSSEKATDQDNVSIKTSGGEAAPRDARRRLRTVSSSLRNAIRASKMFRDKQEQEAVEATAPVPSREKSKRLFSKSLKLGDASVSDTTAEPKMDLATGIPAVEEPKPKVEKKKLRFSFLTVKKNANRQGGDSNTSNMTASRSDPIF
ncbi:hypothetical protein DRE_04330 [Drechslerella stenobrocha 248]|uniref:Uncharacterized protein n=1 Tax=Drechslerella stenobrocha 248 TaxID=1043628 RepID=W7I1K2_9PEZI|nr:hypothetical protein DRE_04330 [Drechslerella stenobrocha 248]